jgi:hypothetical protein
MVPIKGCEILRAPQRVHSHIGDPVIYLYPGLDNHFTI